MPRPTSSQRAEMATEPPKNRQLKKPAGGRGSWLRRRAQPKVANQRRSLCVSHAINRCVVQEVFTNRREVDASFFE